MQIFVFGDSIAWGAWDTEGGWVTRDLHPNSKDHEIIARIVEKYLHDKKWV